MKLKHPLLLIAASLVVYACSDSGEPSTVVTPLPPVPPTAQRANGARCDSPSQCTSGLCTAGVCSAPAVVLPAACTDTIKNGSESDVDCGGSCNKCSEGRVCAAASDCVSGICTGNFCVGGGCGDTVKNGTESDVDCGGSCAKCVDGKVCSVAGDCASGVCTGNLCSAPACNDTVKNGAEPDVDCGGSCVTKCADGKVCGVAGDCASGVCTGNVCRAPTCNDTAKNGTETDVDCGGSCAPAATCAIGKACAASGDCATGICTANVCAAPLKRKVFVSSVLYNGNLGGLAGADAKCQSLAGAAGLGGTFKAWLSDATGSPSTRFVQSSVPYELVNGTLVADNWAGLISGTLKHVIDLTETGGAAPLGDVACGGGNFAVYTNTSITGTQLQANTSCSNWSAVVGSSRWGRAGDPSDASWTDWCNGGSCAWTAPIYCIQQ